tara:strand:+ start:791 stop:1108 length:318 start_codon:yes stop_codon:yes gene_type:complete
MNKKEDIKILLNWYRILCKTLFEELDEVFYKEQQKQLILIYHKLNDKMDFKYFQKSLYVNIMYKEENQEAPQIEDKYFYSVYKQKKFTKRYNNIINNYYNKNNEI